MYEKLATCFLPVDDLSKELYENESLSREMIYVKERSGSGPIEKLITLDLVTNLKIQNVARKYISKLLHHKEKYGYLYFLSGQRMLIPLDIRFKGSEILVDSMDYQEIVTEIEKLASEFACRNTLMYEITLLECYYFYIRLVNLHLTWLAVESILNNVRSHHHLIISPDRVYRFQMKVSNDMRDEKTFVCPQTLYS